MTQLEFDLLAFNEQGGVLWKMGEFVGDRTDAGHRISLYAVQGFFVEAHYHHELNAIIRIESVQDISVLSLYVSDTIFDGLL